jgi:hypothetical protein
MGNQFHFLIHFLKKSGAKNPLPLFKKKSLWTFSKSGKNIILFFLLYNPHGILAPPFPKRWKKWKKLK